MGESIEGEWMEVKEVEEVLEVEDAVGGAVVAWVPGAEARA
jgi:hypothetical protein